VIEIVTGFVRSNILRHGLYAPEGSLYLPIESVVKEIKYGGNENGMPADAYAVAVTEKLLRSRVSPEIWEGGMARSLRLLVLFLPLQFLVRQSLRMLRSEANQKCVVELVRFSKVQT
jgi:1-acylglycerone phosphate reductase